ncbi:hypothetical protein WMY93_026632 [Mugilogobius chulae]|uniref:DED domain-containing protein n=1 Tax=Mugilogobius chulae TaxID=88201 RepID=A0AAW0MY30_9GOBI
MSTSQFSPLGAPEDIYTDLQQNTGQDDLAQGYTESTLVISLWLLVFHQERWPWFWNWFGRATGLILTWDWAGLAAECCACAVRNLTRGALIGPHICCLCGSGRTSTQETKRNVSGYVTCTRAWQSEEQEAYDYRFNNCCLQKIPQELGHNTFAHRGRQHGVEEKRLRRFGRSLLLIMALAHQLSYPFRNLHNWEENECLNYYGLLSLHEIFEIVGTQLTETDIEVLSFLLNETCTQTHPLDPAGWTVEPSEDNPDDAGQSPQQLFASHKPKSGLELLLELENRGYITEGNLEPLLQLLRVLTRHDLLPFVSLKKRRTVSPERSRRWRGAEHRELMFSSGMSQPCRATEMPLSFTQQGRSGLYSPVPVAPAKKRRRRRGNGWSRKPRKNNKPSPPPPPPTPQSISCDVRLRVRAEYLEHESALRSGVSSDKRQPLERQFELFSQANSVLRARSLGSIVCDIKFTELDNLQAFWADYLSGALLEALKGVFINDSLRSAAGSEAVRLLISVDQDDYEEGRRLLQASKGLRSGQAPHFHTHWCV